MVWIWYIQLAGPGTSLNILVWHCAPVRNAGEEILDSYGEGGPRAYRNAVQGGGALRSARWRADFLDYSHE